MKTSNLHPNPTVLNIKYSVFLAAFWGIICVLCGGFTSVFLLSRGFTNSEIGIAMALGNILGVMLQPLFAGVADKNTGMSLHALTLLLSAAVAVGFVALYFVPNPLLAVGVVFVLTYAVIQVIMPLTNAVSMYYVNRGISVNFSLARGIGSVFYAVLSIVLGKLTVSMGTDVLLIVGLALVAVLAAMLLAMPDFKELSEKGGQPCAEKVADDHESLLGFAGKYKGFCGVLAGAMMLFVFHNMSNTYIIQVVENIGGNPESMGKALSLAAFLELPVMAVFPLLKKRFRSYQLLSFAGIAFTAKACAYIFARSMFGLYLAQMFQIGSYAIYIPASVFYVNEIMRPEDTVKGQSLMVGAGTLAGVFAGLLGGIIIDLFGVSAMLIVQAVFAAAGAVLLLIYSRPYAENGTNPSARRKQS